MTRNPRAECRDPLSVEFIGCDVEQLCFLVRSLAFSHLQIGRAECVRWVGVGENLHADNVHQGSKSQLCDMSRSVTHLSA